MPHSISMTGNFRVPYPKNQPERSFAPGSEEAESVRSLIRGMSSFTKDLAHYIGGEWLVEGETKPLVAPHDHQRVLANLPYATDQTVNKAIDAALSVQDSWARTPWWERIAIFLKAAELASGKYANELVAATMLGQSKTFHQAEIDAPCELADFFRYNAYNASQIFDDQPRAVEGKGTYLDQRPLEGFVLAMTPFNFTAIASNLPTTAAMMGNVVVWKPSEKSAYSNDVIMRLLIEAGLPEGVINLVHGDGQLVSDVAMQHRDFAGLSFTGSSAVFRNLFSKAGQLMENYRSFPRLVGETGGKNAIVVHPTADLDAVHTALVRGAFEFQGQKCSAASRAYVPKSLWPELKERLVATTKTLKVGDPSDHDTFVTAVIDQKAAERMENAFEKAKQLDSHTLLVGGSVDTSRGWFVEPTVFETTDPKAFTMEQEFFGPMVVVHPYDDEQWSQTLELVESTSNYALTLSVFSRDRAAIQESLNTLRNAAGMMYINEKPTGAMMGQVNFGGGRGSGTNDKTGSRLSLQRWLSGRFIQETYVPATNWTYDYMGC